MKHFTTAGVDIPCEETLKPLSVDLDFMLNFDNQIKNIHICTKAAQQLNVLQRLSKFLSEDTSAGERGAGVKGAGGG